MSIESAKVFIEKMKTDPDFAKKVSTCKDSEARHSLVKSSGLDFTVEELKKVKSELSEADLDSVAGGCSLEGGHWCDPPYGYK